jgi:hypothetical protein
LEAVKKLIRILLAATLALGAISAHAQRAFNQAELDAVLAPIALYPDLLVTHILNASVFPRDVAAAAAWSRANPQLQGDAALATVEREIWHPSVKALVAYPEVLARMAESPQWLADLGEAYAGSPAAVNAEIQQLRARAQASGNLQSNDQQYVYQQGPEIVVQPVYPQVVYAPYYNPYIVYGTWFWPAYRPVYWRPWVARPVYVTRIVQPVRIVQPRHIVQNPVRLVQPVQITPYRAVPESRRQPIVQSHTTNQWRQMPESRRQPIVQSPPVVRSMPAPQVRFAEHPRAFGQAARAASGGSGNRGGGGGGQGGHSQGGWRHRS